VGHGNKFIITESEGKYYNLSLSLPPNVTCRKCVLRGRYKTGKTQIASVSFHNMLICFVRDNYLGNNWGECGGGKPGALGCGPQTVFHGCSDIAII